MTRSCLHLVPRCPVRRRGAVLILVLIVFSGLSLLALGLCHRVRLQLRMARMQGDQRRAFYLALGGVNRAILALRQDLATKEKDSNVVHFGQMWHVDTTAAAEGLFADMDDAWRASCSLSYATTDEQSRLSVSKSSAAGWLTLPGMTRSIVDSMLDWEDEDEAANPQGAESADYMRLAYPYRAKNEPMETVWELARVMNMDAQRLLGAAASRGTGQAGDGGSSGAAQADPAVGAGLIEYFTVQGDGKVNLNTAGAEVLGALPGIGPQDVREVLAWRAGPDGQPFTSDDRYLRSLDDLKGIPNLGQEAERRLREDYGTLTSDHFRVISRASVRKDSPGVRLWATVRRAGGGANWSF